MQGEEHLGQLDTTGGNDTCLQFCGEKGANLERSGCVRRRTQVLGVGSRAYSTSYFTRGDENEMAI